MESSGVDPLPVSLSLAIPSDRLQTQAITANWTDKLSSIKMSLVEDGTITTQENELYQDEMIESLFSTGNFSEVDTCVEIMGTTRALQESSCASRQTYKYVSLSSHSKSKMGERRSATSTKALPDNNTDTDNTLTTAPGGRMQPVDEDIHNMVREDVRKMIAKIRSVKQPKQQQKEHAEEEKTDKMIVNPGKYGEVDLRNPSAMARKKLFQNIKKEKIKKKKKQEMSPKTPTPSKFPEDEQKGAATEQREDIQAVNTEEKKDSQRSNDWMKTGYYKNKPEDGPEHIIDEKLCKGKEATSSSKQQCQIATGNASVTSSTRSASKSVVSKSRSRKSESKVEAKSEMKGSGTSAVSKSHNPKRNNETSGGASKIRKTTSGGASVASASKSQPNVSGKSSVASKQHHQSSGSVSNKSLPMSGTSSVASKTQKGDSSAVVTNKIQSMGGSLDAVSKTKSKMNEPDGLSLTVGPEDSKPSETKVVVSEPQDSKHSGPKPQAKTPKLDPESTVEAIVMIEKTIEQIEKWQDGDKADKAEGEDQTLSSDDIGLSLSEWKPLHQPILSMPITQNGAGTDQDESEEIECVLAPFGEFTIEPEPAPSIKPDPSVASDKNKNLGDEIKEQDNEERETKERSQQKQERGVAPPGERAQPPDPDDEEDHGDRSPPKGINRRLDITDDLSGIFALSSATQPILINAIKTVDLPIVGTARGSRRLQTGTSGGGNENETETKPQNKTRSLIAAMQRDIGASGDTTCTPGEVTTLEDATPVEPTTVDASTSPVQPTLELREGEETGGDETAETTVEDTTGETGEDTSGEETTGDTGDDGTVELMLVDDAIRLKQLEIENAKLKDTLHFLQQTAVDKEKYFAELAWFGKRSEEEVQKWRPHFWRERLKDLGPDLFEEFRADAMRIADPDVGDWEHGFSSGSLAMARLLLGLSHAVDDEKICAFHDLGEPCTKHCVTCSVTEQRKRELADFPVLDP